MRLYPNWQRECVESAFSGRSSRPRRTNFSLQLRYASGEAARLSIGREGFDLPTERQFLKTTGCSSARPELLPWKQEAVGSNPTALTIYVYGRWCAVVRNRSRKPGRPLGRGFDSFTFPLFCLELLRNLAFTPSTPPLYLGP